MNIRFSPTLAMIVESAWSNIYKAICLGMTFSIYDEEIPSRTLNSHNLWFPTSTCDANFRRESPIKKAALAKRLRRRLELHKISIRFHNSGLLYKVEYLEHFMKFTFFRREWKRSLENWARRGEEKRSSVRDMFSGETFLYFFVFFLCLSLSLFSSNGEVKDVKKLISCVSEQNFSRATLEHHAKHKMTYISMLFLCWRGHWLWKRLGVEFVARGESSHGGKPPVAIWRCSRCDESLAIIKHSTSVSQKSNLSTRLDPSRLNDSSERFF